jgi:hypothetical protein
MSQNSPLGVRAQPKPLARAHSVRASLLVGVLWLSVGAAHPADAADAKPKTTPPGVWVEPPRPRRDTDKNREPAPERREPTSPGCPANDRKLELLV